MNETSPTHPETRNRKRAGCREGVLVLALIVCLGCIVPILLNPMLMPSLSTVSDEHGTWVDDPENWERLFHEPLPVGVNNFRSYYWTSDHFTHEYVAFFKFDASDAWIDGFLTKYNATSQGDVTEFYMTGDEYVTWFEPKPGVIYEHWTINEVQVYIDRKNGIVFLMGYSI